MHGGPGTGKNYVSQFIIDHLYLKGDKSKFVHRFAAAKDFPDKSQNKKYKEELTLINNTLQECPRSLFIFDKADEMRGGLINAAIRIGVLYPEAIFLLLSNTTGTDINPKLLEHVEAEKPEYEHLTSTEMEKTSMEMEQIIKSAALKENLWYANLLKKDRISAIVPFLPLERDHVKNCIRDEMSRNYVDAYVSSNKEKFVNMVADKLEYFRAHSKHFSKDGCKDVEDTLSLILDDY